MPGDNCSPPSSASPLSCCHLGIHAILLTMASFPLAFPEIGECMDWENEGHKHLQIMPERENRTKRERERERKRERERERERDIR